MAKATPSQKPANRPEAKFGPFPGGILIAVRVNEVQGDPPMPSAGFGE